MRDWYTYEIWTRRTDGSLRLHISGENLFSREPTENVRSLLHMWIIENRDSIAGGERLTVHGPGSRPLPASRIPVVQVLLYRGRRDQVEHARSAGQAPVASAYLSHGRPRTARPHTGRVRGGDLRRRRWFPRRGIDDAA